MPLMRSCSIRTTNMPFNPMVNAGAITVSGIVHEVAGKGAFDLILEKLSRSGGPPP